MTARDYFESVASVAGALERRKQALAVLDADGLKGISYDRTRVSCAAGGDGIAAKIAARCKLLERIREDEAAIKDALVVLFGVRSLFGRKYSTVLVLRFVRLMTWREVAREMSCSHAWCIQLTAIALDYCDGAGLARLREAGNAAMTRKG